MNKGPNQSHLAASRATDCSQQPLLFADLGSRQVVTEFTAGDLSSDGGVPLLRPVDHGLGLARTLNRLELSNHQSTRCHKLAHDPAVVEHCLLTMGARSAQARARSGAGPRRGLTGTPSARVFTEFDYQTQRTWSRARVNPNDPQRSPTCADMVKSMDNGGNMHSAVDGTVPISNAPCSVVVSWLRVTKPGSRSLGRSFATCSGRDFRMSFFTTASQSVNVSRQV